jgi:outer membrane protein
MAGKATLKSALALLPLLCATTVRADTLREALIAAYRTNPSLTGARAGLRAIDEGVPIAKAAARPILSATADYQEVVVRSSNSFSAPLRATSANARLSLPLYQGGQVKNSIRAAEARDLNLFGGNANTGHDGRRRRIVGTVDRTLHRKGWT